MFSSIGRIIVLMTVIGVISAKIDGGFDTSPNTQYHIQTDEGPERYFRYQTISGQYRKEKRLQDGTVVGSYGWVDPDGYLLLNDYIADNQGYRILKSKRVYVGLQTPIDSAISAAKYLPAQSGTEVVNNPSPHNINTIPPGVSQSQSVHLQTQWPGSQNDQPHSADFSGLLQPISAIQSTTSAPYFRDNSRPLIFPSASPSVSSSHYYKKRPTPPAGYYPTTTTTLSPISGYQDLQDQYQEKEIVITPKYRIPSSTQRPPFYYIRTTTSTPYNYYNNKSPLYTSVVKSQPSYNNNGIDSYNSQSYEGKSSYSNRRLYPNSVPQYDRRQSSASNYNGVAVTRNGFRYYLPRHYHEEESLPNDTKAGSFGYIDPFGIRRVVYYNASPESGFVHKKNNRYVGFDATPYDPRP